MIDWESFYGAFRQPDFIPGYEIQNHLGGGAFGEVYKARKTSIGKAYAVKFLRLDDSAQRDAVERELDQVRLFAAIDHPNLVTIEDMGVVKGVPYLLMGYAGEDTLARRLKRGEIDQESALRFFVQIARGVLALHDRRLAHFDLKPSNVFLNGDVARVGDYGLAKLLTEGRATLSFGRGTPHYMAPEMLRNRADHRADLYSLGVILYESLTLRLPFGAGDDGALIMREDDHPPEFPSGFPPAMRPVVERCLRLEPENRYGSVHELLSVLGQTARQGDSVRIPWEGAAPRPSGNENGDRDGGGEGGEDSRATREELRTAAAELARGAVGVARGMWDGVVERVSNKAGSGGGGDGGDGRVVPEQDEGAEVLVVQSLEDPDEDMLDEMPPSGAFSAPDAPWRLELKRARQADEAARIGSGVLPALATVPVPPRAEGGFSGSVVQSFLVGAEIMGALVTGPVMVFARGTAATFDRAVRGLPGVFGRLIRFGLYLLLMSVIGAVCAFVLLAAVALNA